MTTRVVGWRRQQPRLPLLRQQMTAPAFVVIAEPCGLARPNRGSPTGCREVSRTLGGGWLDVEEEGLKVVALVDHRGRHGERARIGGEQRENEDENRDRASYRHDGRGAEAMGEDADGDAAQWQEGVGTHHVEGGDARERCGWDVLRERGGP